MSEIKQNQIYLSEGERIGYYRAISEMSKPQSTDTCPWGHPRWALVEVVTKTPILQWIQVEKKCSTCAAVEAERRRGVGAGPRITSTKSHGAKGTSEHFLNGGERSKPCQHLSS